MADHSGSRNAEATCTVKYHAECPDCKRKIFEILSSLRGEEYDIAFENVGGYLKLSGEVDPNVFVRAINRDVGEHGELVRARITKVDKKKHINYGCTHGGNNLALIEGRTGSYPALPPPTSYNALSPAGNDEVGQRVVVYPYGYEQPRGHCVAGCNNYCCRPMPKATYVPSYPPVNYDRYREYDSWEKTCNIM